MDLRYPLIDVNSVGVAPGGSGCALRLLTDIPEINSALAYHLTIPSGGARGVDFRNVGQQAHRHRRNLPPSR